MYSKNGEIRRDETCLDYSGHDVVLYPCHGAKGNQLWLYDPNVSNIPHLLYVETTQNLPTIYLVIRTLSLVHRSN